MTVTDTIEAGDRVTWDHPVLGEQAGTVQPSIFNNRSYRLVRPDSGQHDTPIPVHKLAREVT